MKTQNDHNILSKIANQVPGVIYQYRLRPDGSSHFPFASEKIREIYRVTPDEVKEDASCLFALLHPDDYDSVVESIFTSAKTLTPWNYEYRIKFSDGVVCWLHGNAEPELEADGSVLWHGFITDITERKKTEQALENSQNRLFHNYKKPLLNGQEPLDTEQKLIESENRFKVMADSAPVLIWMSGLDKLCFWFNQVWLDFTGHTMEKLLGNGWTEDVHPDDFQRCLDYYVSHFDARQSFTMEYRLKRRDGEYRWILDSGVPRFDNKGNFAGYIGSCIDITERKQVEEKLHESEEKFRSYMDYAPDGIFIVDEIGRYVEVNPAACEITGYSENELLQKHISDLLPKSELEKGIALFHDLQQNGATCADIGFVTKSGEHRFWSLAAVKLSDTRLLGFTKDITERKQAEQALRESQQLFYAVFDNAGVGIAQVSLTGQFLQINQEYCRILGYTQTEIIEGAFTFQQVTTIQEDLRIDLAHVNTLLNSNKSRYHMEKRYLRKDGSLIWVNLFVHLVRNEKNQPLYFVCAVTDISEQKQNEQALIESEYRWKFAVDGSGDGLWDWNIASNKVFYSPNWKKLLGFQEYEINNTFGEWEKRLHPDDKEDVLKAVESYVLGKTSVYFKEYRLLCKNGSYKWMLGRGMIVERAENGTPLRMIGTLSDISQLKQTEGLLQQLLAQERMNREEQSQFMAMLAHELKTPLAVIQLALNVSSEISEIFQHASKALSDINNIVNRCLQSEKLADNQVELYVIEGDLLQELEKQCTKLSSAYRIRIDADFYPKLTTDWQFFSIIVQNLLDNALKYSLHESKIEIEIKPEKDGVLLVFKNLIGSSSFPDKNKVFQKYYRHKAAQQESGSGLGLYLIKTMVTLLGGNVHYQHDKTSVYFKLWLPF